MYLSVNKQPNVRAWQLLNFDKDKYSYILNMCAMLEKSNVWKNLDWVKGHWIKSFVLAEIYIFL